VTAPRTVAGQRRGAAVEIGYELSWLLPVISQVDVVWLLVVSQATELLARLTQLVVTPLCVR
jgi:hypothetical protein